MECLPSSAKSQRRRLAHIKVRWLDSEAEEPRRPTRPVQPERLPKAAGAGSGLCCIQSVSNNLESERPECRIRHLRGPSHPGCDDVIGPAPRKGSLAGVADPTNDYNVAKWAPATLTCIWPPHASIGCNLFQVRAGGGGCGALRMCTRKT